MLIDIAEASIGVKRGKMNVPTPYSLHELPEARDTPLLVELVAWVLQPSLSFPILMLLPLWAPSALVA